MMTRSVRVTMLHPRWLRDPKLPPVSDVVLSLPDYSLRVVHREGNPLWTIPMNMAPESHS
jgi:hypothetical protein